MKKTSFGNIMIVIGLCLLFGAAVLWRYNWWESERAGELSSDTVALLSAVYAEATMPAETECESTQTRKEMPTQEINGIDYLGVLKISVLELELPVISAWSEKNARTAPCRYSGSVYSEDMILCAHNYRSHFGRLSALSPGDSVVFTDVEGNSYSYQVAEMEVLDGTDLVEMAEGDWDLTLFTCTSGGKARFTVRCIKDE